MRHLHLYTFAIFVGAFVFRLQTYYAQEQPRRTEGDFLFDYASSWVYLTVPLHRNSNDVRFYNYFYLHKYIQLHLQILHNNSWTITKLDPWCWLPLAGNCTDL